MEELNRLAQQLLDLNRTKKELEAKQERVRKMIHELGLKPGTYKYDTVKVSLTNPIVRPKVLDANQIPAMFTKLTADTEKIREHFRETGETVPGIDIKITPGNLTVSEVE